jgi:pimeloyl-ACP methyl ester carboxylesterase
VTERPVFFAAETVLFGIVTEPGHGEPRRRAVILLNAGADYHIGASRMYVSLSRRWARRGYVVLRMDLAGIGDSSKRPGNADDDVFPTEALDDIKAAIDFLRSRYNIQEITLAGLCSGAYHALRAAAAGLAVSRILMINPQNYFWKKGMTLNDLQLAEVVRNPGVYRHQVVSAAAWKRLLTGQVNVWRIANIYVQRFFLALESALRDVARRLRIRLPHDLGWELEEIGSRGVRMVFVFARGEPGIDLLKIEGGSSVKRLGERCRVHIVDSGDHIFSHSNPRAVLENILSDELFARVDWGPSQQSASNRN